jgi:VWFA-related protein
MLRHRVVFFLAACVFVCAECAHHFVQAQTQAQVGIAVSVELVQIPIIVFDDKGTVATELTKDDFRIFDNGVEQRILYFERERVPVSFVVLADLSSSMTRKIPFVQQAALSLLDSPDQQGQLRDEYSIVAIGKRSRQLLAFTSDENDLERRLPLLLSPTDESTALFDGIWMGVSTARREALNRNRAMIIITDGGDNRSRYNLRETRRFLEEADMPVFAVMAGPTFELPQIFSRPAKEGNRRGGPRPKMQLPDLLFNLSQDDYIGPAERRGPRNMKELTEVTGGGVFTARHGEDLSRIVRTIGRAVRYRYILCYKPVHGSGFVSERNSRDIASGDHKVVVELYPKEKFQGYSFPYYKRTYHRVQ